MLVSSPQVARRCLCLPLSKVGQNSDDTKGMNLSFVGLTLFFVVSVHMLLVLIDFYYLFLFEMCENEEKIIPLGEGMEEDGGASSSQRRRGNT